jgi:hypothetical protein
MTDPLFAFQPPADASPEMRAAAVLGHGLDNLRAAVADLAAQHRALAAKVAARHKPAAPGPLRWDTMDRAQATLTWLWLINWVGWLTGRYQLDEEIPPCWPRHAALIEELTALCAAWHLAYDGEANPDAPMRWHEALARTRTRLRDWDETTRCRNGTHTDRRIELAWPTNWRDTAIDTAEADIATRPPPSNPDTPPQGGEHP